MGILAASSWRDWFPPYGYLGLLLTASLCRTTVSLWRTSLFDPFPTLRSGFLRFSFFMEYLLQCFFVFWIAQHFCRLLDFSPWKDLSWWCQCYGWNLLLTLRSDFVIHRNLLWRFHLIHFLCLCDWTWCNLHRSASLLSLFVLSMLWSEFYSILFYNDLFFLTLRSELLVGHPLGGIVWLIVFFDRSSHYCHFTVCRESPLPDDHGRTSIE